jgi:hypothetical protein
VTAFQSARLLPQRRSLPDPVLSKAPPNSRRIDRRERPLFQKHAALGNHTIAAEPAATDCSVIQEVLKYGFDKSA